MCGTIMNTENDQISLKGIIEFAENCPIEDLTYLKKQIECIHKKRQQRIQKHINSVKRKLKTNADSTVIALLEQMTKEKP